jgi:hypothetical protein
VTLQDARQQADYAKVRNRPAANEYLLSLLIGSKRE